MPVQIVTTRFEAEFSDHERFNELLRQEARNAGLAEDGIEALNKDIESQGRSIREVEAAYRKERAELARLQRAQSQSTQVEEQNQLQREIDQTTARLKELGAEARRTGAIDATPEVNQPATTSATPAATGGGGGAGLGNIISGNIIASGVSEVLSGIRQQITQIASESIELFGIQEQAEAKVLATIEATNGAALRSFEELKASASELQLNSTFGDEAILEAQSTLLTFRNVQGEVFDRTIQSAADLSTVLGTDLESTTLQLGKAIQDPILGISALGRAGIQFTEDQKEVIKSLVETGDIAAAQAIILNEVEQEVGGAAAAVAQTTTGQVTQLQNAIGDIKEEIGEELLPAQIGALELQQTFTEVLLRLVRGFITFVNVIRGIPEFLRENRVEFLLLGAAILTLNGATIASTAATIADNAVKLAATARARALAIQTAILNSTMLANPVFAIVAGFLALGAAFVALYRNSQTVRAGLAGLWNAIQTVGNNAIEGISQRLSALRDILVGVFTFDLDQIEAGAEAFSEARGIGEGVADSFNEGFDKKLKADQASAFVKNITGQLAKAVEDGEIEAEGEKILDRIEKGLENGTISDEAATELRAKVQNAINEASAGASFGSLGFGGGDLGLDLSLNDDGAAEALAELRDGIVDLREELAETQNEFDNTDFSITSGGTEIENIQQEFVAVSNLLDSLEADPNVSTEQVEAATERLKELQTEFQDLASAEEALLKLRIELEGDSVEGIGLQFEQEIQNFQEAQQIDVPVDFSLIQTGDAAGIEEALRNQGFSEERIDILTQSLVNRFEAYQDRVTAAQRSAGEQRAALVENEFAEQEEIVTATRARQDSNLSVETALELARLRELREADLISQFEYEQQSNEIREGFNAERQRINRERIESDFAAQRDQIANLETLIAEIGDPEGEEESAYLAQLESQLAEVEEQAGKTAEAMADIPAQTDAIADVDFSSVESLFNAAFDENSGEIFAKAIADGQEIGTAVAAGAEFAAQQINSVFDLQQQRLAQQRDAALAAAGDNAAERERIEADFARREQRIAIGRAFVNTAAAVTKTLATVAPPFSFVLAGITAAQAAAQIALIRQQRFAEGTRELTSTQSRSIALNGANKGTDTIPAVIRQSNEPILVDEGERIVSRKTNRLFFDDFNAVEDGAFSPGELAALAQIAPEDRYRDIIPVNAELATPTPVQNVFVNNFGGEVSLKDSSMKKLASLVADEMAFRDDETERIARSRGRTVGSNTDELARAIAMAMKKIK